MFKMIVSNKNNFSFRIYSLLFCVIFSCNFIIFPTNVYSQPVSETGFNLPLPGTMLGATEAYVPPLMTGIVPDPNDPLEFEFIIDNGDADLDGEALQEEAEKLIKYFLVTLTIPEEKLWVNLSPYEEKKIISNVLGETEMGRDLLGQDYILKQLSASLMHPEEELGKTFWDRAYARAKELFGTEDIPLNTFNKVWIVPDKATIHETEEGAFVVDSHLKVMLEEDYLALQKNRAENGTEKNKTTDDEAKEITEVTTQVIREVMIPAIEKEVNEGKTFANLRQIYNSMILGTWYKENLKESFLGQVYVNQNKIKGVDLDDPAVKDKIYQQYLTAFQDGVYNYIQKNYDPETKEIVIQKYFAGGADFTRIQSAVSRPISDLSRLSARRQAGVLRSMASSPMSRNRGMKQFEGLSQSRQKEIRTLMNQMSSSPPHTFTVHFAPQKGVANLLDELRKSNMNLDIGSSPVAFRDVTNNLMAWTRGEIAQMRNKVSQSGSIQLGRNAADVEMKFNEAGGSAPRVVAVTNKGNTIEVVNPADQTRTPITRNELESMVRSDVKPIVIGSQDALDFLGGQVAELGGFTPTTGLTFQSGSKQYVNEADVENRAIEIASNMPPIIKVSNEGKRIERRNPDGSRKEISMSELQDLVDMDVKPVVFGTQANINALQGQIELAGFNTVETDMDELANLKQLSADLQNPPPSFKIPESQKEALGARSPDFTIANNLVKKQQGGGDLGEIAPAAQQILPVIGQEIGRIASEIDNAPSLAQKENLFRNTLLPAIALDNELSIHANNTAETQLALTPYEREIVQLAPDSIPEPVMSRVVENLGAKLSEARRLEGLARQSGASNTEVEKVGILVNEIDTSLKAVNRARGQKVTTQQIEQRLNEVGLQGVRGEVVNTYTMPSESSITELSRLDLPTFEISSQGEIRPISKSEAVRQFALGENEAVAYTFRNFAVVELRNEMRRAPTPQRIGELAQGLSNQFRIAERNAPRIMDYADKRLQAHGTVGGIDLNPSLLALNIKVDGNGVTLPLSQQPEEVMNIQGFVPVIIDVSPTVYDASSILGQNQ